MIGTGLASDQHAVLAALAERLPLDGADVVEIGGALPPEATAARQVASWTALDPRNRPQRAPGYTAHPADAAATGLPAESCDVVFSSNALHLMSPLPAVLDEMARVLRPGGRLFAQFGPVWSAPDGHQLENVRVDGRELLFWRDHLIPHWFHLLFDERELAAILGSAVRPHLAAAVVHHVYRGDWVNRIFCDDYPPMFEAAGFTIEELGRSSDLDYRAEFPDYRHPLLHDPRLRDPCRTIRARHGPGAADLATRDLTVLLTRA